MGKFIENVLKPVSVEYDEPTERSHPNIMGLIAYMGTSKLAEMHIYSVGGGTFRVE